MLSIIFTRCELIFSKLSANINYSDLSYNQKIKLVHELSFFLKNGILKNEKLIIEDIIYKIYNDEESKFFQNLIEQIFCFRVDGKLLRSLAFDNLTIAKELILKFGSLDDLDVLNICKYAIDTENFVKVLVLRGNLSTIICDYIVSVKDVNSIEQMISNKKAQISVSTYCEIFESYFISEKIRNFIYQLIYSDKEFLDKMMNNLKFYHKKLILIKLLEINHHEILYLTNEQKLYGFEFVISPQLKGILNNTINALYINDSLTQSVMLKFLFEADIYSFAYALSTHLELQPKFIKKLLMQNFYSVDLKEVLFRSGFCLKSIEICRLILRLIYESCIGCYKKNSELALIIKNQILDNYKHEYKDIIQFLN